MYNVPYIPDASGLSAEVAENKFSLFINIKINIVYVAQKYWPRVQTVHWQF